MTVYVLRFMPYVTEKETVILAVCSTYEKAIAFKEAYRSENLSLEETDFILQECLVDSPQW